MSEPTEHRIEVPLSKSETLAALAAAADLWGAEWRREGTGGRLALPVVAGVRHGLLRGRIWTEPAAAGTRLIFRVEDSHYSLHWRAVVILLFGAGGALAATLWPFYPPLLGVAPVAIVLAFAAWFLVASRVRSAGPEEFLEILAHPLETPPAAPEQAEAIEP